MLAGPVASQEPCRKILKMDDFLLPGDAVAAKQTFVAFQKALVSGDRQRVVSEMKVPADLVINGYPTKFEGPADLLSRYNSVFNRYVTRSVAKQKPENLLAGWDGVTFRNETVVLVKNESGGFEIGDVRQEPFPPRSGSIADFMASRLTCPPVVIDGRIVAYNWVSHSFPGFENIYADHLIVDVLNVVRGTVPQKRIRVDFWSVSNLSDYNLPKEVFERGRVWRIYLRPAASPPPNDEVCGKDVPETISDVDETGRKLGEHSAIQVLNDEEAPTYTGLPCFEARKQYFTPISVQSVGSAK